MRASFRLLMTLIQLRPAHVIGLALPALLAISVAAQTPFVGQVACNTCPQAWDIRPHGGELYAFKLARGQLDADPDVQFAQDGTGGSYVCLQPGDVAGNSYQVLGGNYRLMETPLDGEVVIITAPGSLSLASGDLSSGFVFVGSTPRQVVGSLPLSTGPGVTSLPSGNDVEWRPVMEVTRTEDPFCAPSGDWRRGFVIGYNLYRLDVAAFPTPSLDDFLRFGYLGHADMSQLDFNVPDSTGFGGSDLNLSDEIRLRNPDGRPDTGDELVIWGDQPIGDVWYRVQPVVSGDQVWFDGALTCSAIGSRLDLDGDGVFESVDVDSNGWAEYIDPSGRGLGLTNGGMILSSLEPGRAGLVPGEAECDVGFFGSDCSDGIDGDGDGLVDCEDPDCALDEDCIEEEILCEAGPDQSGCGAFSLQGTVEGGAPPLTIQWRSSCPGTVFLPADDVLDPDVILDAPCGFSCELTLDVQDASGATCSDRTRIDFVDDEPPTLQGVPVDDAVECNEVPPPAMVRAVDACDPAPVVSLQEVRSEEICPGEYLLTRTWTAIDACGNETRARQEITVTDTVPPSLIGIPRAKVVECDDVPEPATVTTSDACSEPVTLEFEETQSRGTCPDQYTLLRIWTAIDACGNQRVGRRELTVVDSVAPELQGVLPDTTAECGDVPGPAAVTATDTCDPSPLVRLDEVRIDGACEGEYTLVRTWTATDRCRNETVAERSISVVDTLPPILSGVPGDETVECDAVPPPSPVTASDACDSAPSVVFSESRTDGACPGEYTLVRTWTARDACGNTSADEQRVSVVDTTPPVVEAADDLLLRLWPPNHEMVPLSLSGLSPRLSDACSEPVTWRFAGCRSNQPDEAPLVGVDFSGDGNTTGDCVVSADGETLLMRAERSGGGVRAQAGRRYVISIVATDACGNESEPVEIGHGLVAHDQGRN